MSILPHNACVTGRAPNTGTHLNSGSRAPVQRLVTHRPPLQNTFLAESVSPFRTPMARVSRQFVGAWRFVAGSTVATPANDKSYSSPSQASE